MAEIGKREILGQEVFDDIKEFTKDIEGATIAVKGLADAGKAIGINLKAAQSTKEVREETEKLTLSQIELQKVEKQIETANARNTQAYRDKQKALNDIKTATKDATTLGEKNAQSINAQNASLKELQAALAKNRAAYAALSNEEARASKEGVQLKSIIDQQDKSVKQINGSLGNFRDNVGDYEGSFKRAGGAFQQIAPGAASAAQGILGMVKASIAFIATPIGLVVAALGAAIFALTSYFKGSEEGQNRLNKITAVGAAIFEQFMNVVEAIGEAIYDAFTDPVQAIKDFGNFLVQNIVNRFVGMFELIPQLGKSIKLLFEGNFKEAGKVAFDAVAKVTTGVENATAKIGGLIDETKKLVDQGVSYGNAIAKLEADIDKRNRELIVQRAKSDLEVAKLREAAISLEGKARKKALEDAIALEQNLSDKEFQFAQLKFKLSSLKVKANGDEKDALLEQAEAEAELYRAQKLANDNTFKFRKQIEALNQKEIDEEKAKTKAITDRMDKAGEAIDKTIKKNADLSASTKSTTDEIVAYFNAAYGEVEKVVVSASDKIAEKFRETMAGISAQLGVVQQYFDDFASATFQIFSGISERRLQALDKESEAIQEKLEKDLLLAGDNEAAKERLRLKAEKDEAAIERRKREEKRKTAILDKALAIVSATINLAKSITAMLAVGPAGFALAALSAALAGAQLAAIIATPIPQFFKGTDSAPGGLAFVGEQGTELMRKPGSDWELTPSVATLMDVPRGTEIVPHDRTMRMLAMGALERNGGGRQVTSSDPALLQELKNVNHNLQNIKHPKQPSFVNSVGTIYAAIEDSKGNIKIRKEINLGKFIKQ